MFLEYDAVVCELGPHRTSYYVASVLQDIVDKSGVVRVQIEGGDGQSRVDENVRSLLFFFSFKVIILKFI